MSLDIALSTQQSLLLIFFFPSVLPLCVCVAAASLSASLLGLHKSQSLSGHYSYMGE